METLEIHSLTQAIIHVWMETTCLNVCRAIHCVRMGIISFTAGKKANLYEYVLTSQPVQVDFAD